MNMNININEQFPTMDPETSHKLNDLANFCIIVFEPPSDLIAQLVIEYDNLDERNNAIIFSCFARALMLIGKKPQDVEAIMKDEENCQKYIDAFMESIYSTMLLKNQIEKSKEYANQIIRH